MGNRIQQVDAYIADVPMEKQAIVQELRDWIHETLPILDETFQYKMPVFDHKGMVCALAARKHYFSLYCNTDVVEKYREALGKLNVGKGCIRFRQLDDLPMETIQTILEESITINDDLPETDN